MNHKLRAPLLLAGLLLPVAGHAAETSYGADAAASMTTESTAMEYVEDSVITTKIKAELAADQISSLVNIHVDTDQAGAVVLSGGAADQAAVDKAVSIAEGVEGVTSVKHDIRVEVDQ
ncbi:BON domain-containing protein [Aeromonas eucrenophila]|uniref:BON domain-containing protein n=1 Tax=Aeromonas eucrenophila TaxID=649 RepID=A0ABW0Y872_9GAMM|nr:BON domain-containing protein [Aeromonas eucrenophila]